MMAKAKFVLCPDGDFTWTYRFFEAILLKAIPLIENQSSCYKNYISAKLGDTVEYDTAVVNHNFELALRNLTLSLKDSSHDYVDFLTLLARVSPRRLLHIGGHIGQEGDIYRELNFDFVFVEPVAEFAQIMRSQQFNVIQCAVSSHAQQTLKINKQTTSLLDRIKSTNTPVVQARVAIKTLAEIQDGFDALVVDTEGTTLDVLKSGDLRPFKAIIVETREKPAFIGEATRKDVFEYLGKTHTLIVTYGRDSLFFRNDLCEVNDFSQTVDLRTD